MGRLAIGVWLLVIHGASAPVRGELGDPTLRTDHPRYAGEGAFQTVDDCVKFAVTQAGSPQQRALALYQWLLTHQWHLMSPQEWCVPGVPPDTLQTRDYESVVYDANRARFSYGYGLCGTVHAWNEPYWQALGMRARRRAFPGHVNSEVFYDGRWHAFDTDMAGLLFRRDGVVAGYEDIVADPSLVDSVRPPIPHYPFAWPDDFKAMRRGWQEVARGGDWYAMYNSGYAAHPGIVQLRTGEAFTRWYDRDHFGGPTKRRFWHHQPGGPSRHWSFVGQRQPVHDGAEHNARNDVTYCNGEFEYRPDLSGPNWHDGIVAARGDIAARSDTPRLYSVHGEPVSVTFRHFSPYVIAGDPEDDANPMTGPAVGGLVVAGAFVGDVLLEISADEGQTWQPVDIPASPYSARPAVRVQEFRIDLTEQVKGRYGWQLRCSWQGESGLDAVEFTTVTQVCQTIYPRLKVEGSEATYRAASRGVVAVLPNFSLPEAEVHHFEEAALRSQNVAYRGRSVDSRVAYETTDNKPGQVVFRIEAPRKLLEVRAAVRYRVRVPPPEAMDVRLEVSSDGGSSWTGFARADIPSDNEFSSGWLAGHVDVASAETQQALVRVHFEAGGYRAALIDAQLYGIYETGSPPPVTITCGWREAGQARRHVEELPANVREHVFTVPTGVAVQDEFVRIEAR